MEDLDKDLPRGKYSEAPDAPFVDGAPRSGCCSRRGACCTRRRALTCALFVAVLGGCMYATYDVTHRVDKSKYVHAKPPPTVCQSNFTLQMDGTWYYGVRHASYAGIKSDFLYVLQFSPINTVRYADNNALVMGNMFTCNQIKHTQANGPFNCTDSFVYNTADCTLAVGTGKCSDHVISEITDMHPVWFAYDSQDDNVQIEFTSHFPGAGGLVVLRPVENGTRPIDCPNHQSF